MLPLIALLLPLMLILAGFAVNVAYMQLSATEVQIATDASARAAGRIYSLTQDESEAMRVANEAGALNLVAGDALVFANGDIEFGQSTRAGVESRYQFVDTAGVDTNAIRISGNRTAGSSSGPVNIFFPTIMGTTSFNLSASTISTQMEVDIAVVFDRSGSMAYANDEVAAYPPIPAAAPAGWDFGDPTPNNSRWLDAVAACNLFLNKLNKSPMNELVCLCTYADMGDIDVGLTSTYASILTGLNVHTNEMHGGGTNIAGGLEAAEFALTGTDSRPFASPVVILMTDGHQTVGPDPVYRAGKMAEDNGIMTITVTFSDEADQPLMIDVADAGNGLHFHAETEQELNNVFEEIGRQLPTLLTK